MILSELNKLLLNVANSNYLVNEAFVGDVYSINSKENKFGCFVATPMTALKGLSGTIRYRYVLYYIDRLVKDESNIDFVQSDGVSVLKGLLDFIEQNGVGIEEGFEFTLFRQKFSDWCAGVYVNVYLLVQDSDCGEGDFNLYGDDLRPLNVDKNGIYTPGTFTGYNKVTINVPQVGATEAWVDDEIDLKLNGYATQSWVSSQGYLTRHQNLGSYATKEYVDDEIEGLREEFPNLAPYAQKNWVIAQGYISECNLDPYATKNWVENQNYISGEQISDMVTESWVRNQGFLLSGDLTGYATKNYVQTQGFLVSDDLSGYAQKNWVVTQGFIKTSELTSYATQSWVIAQNYLVSDDLCGLATESYVRNWVTAQDYLSSCDLNPYATQNWVENQGYVTTSLFSTTLSSYATRSWVSNNYVSNSFFTTTLSSYATKSWVSNNYVNNSTITSYATKSWISSQMFVTESWISENSYMSASDMSVYLLKSNGNGTTSMVFGPELPYIYLKSGGNNLTVRPYQIAMQGPNAYTQVLTNQITIDQSTTSTMAGVWYEPNVNTCVLGVRDHSDEIGLMIDCKNIYFEEGEDNITSLPLSDLATKTWVSSQGYLTSVPSGYATESWVENQGYLSSIPSGYATQSWVSSQGYLTSVPSGYATESWVSTYYFEESKIWTGTASQWASLTSAQKSAYTIALIIE